MFAKLLALMQWLLQTIRDPGALIVFGGYPALALIVFLETGALCFFLPGDSLLVVAGLYAAKGSLNIWMLNLLLIPLAIIGDAVSYIIGKQLGQRLFTRPRSRFFRPEYLQRAHEFYEKHGGKAIVLARFVPIIRTFVPVVAGVAAMSYRRFATFNIFGGLGWVLSMTLTGYFLGLKFPILGAHIEKVIVLIVCLSLVPLCLEYFKDYLQKKRALKARVASGAATFNEPRAGASLGCKMTQVEMSDS